MNKDLRTHHGEPRARRALGALLVCLAAASPAAAQERYVRDGDRPEYVEDPDSMDAVDLLERRERGSMHPGAPFRIVGIGQGDNDFREGLNAAARGAYRPALLERDSLRDRQLAMYEGGARFSSSTRRLDRSLQPTAPDGAPGDGREEPPGEGGRGTAWIGVLLAAGAAGAYVLQRGRAGG